MVCGATPTGIGRLRAQGLLQDAEYDAAIAAARRSADGAVS